jgi:hypothetical protein
MLLLLGVAVAACLLAMRMDHSHHGAVIEARTSVVIQDADGGVTLRTLDDVAKSTKDL